ncbi:MAG: OsmC family protein [Actinobacteria bacterium]|nr:OsmC family protein [Actinomycetota bacterium]
MATMRVWVRALDGHVSIGRQEEGHVLPLDRPEATGGTGLGFNGGHLMLLGWGGCFKSTLLAAAEARDIEVRGLELSITGETADSPYRVEQVSMSVTLDADLDEDGKRRLIEIARNGCAVSNTLQRGAELQISLTQ